MEALLDLSSCSANSITDYLHFSCWSIPRPAGEVSPWLARDREHFGISGAPVLVNEVVGLMASVIAVFGNLRADTPTGGSS